MRNDSEKLRIGVVGAGWFASRRHLPELVNAPDAEIAALCRRDPERLAQMAAHFGVERTYRSYEEMLDREPMDGLLIVTPHNLHHPQTMAALERGIPVLLEKPMAIRSQDAQEMADLAQAKGLPLLVALNPPYSPYGNMLRSVLREERVGSLESVAISWHGNSEHVFGRAPMPENLPGVTPPTLFRGDPEANGGGYFIDGGSHLVSEVLWVTGRRCLRVQALMDDSRADTVDSVSLELEGGVVASILTRANSTYPERRARHHYFCSRCTLHISGPPFVLTEEPPGIVPEIVTHEAEMPPVVSPVRNFLDVLRGTAEPLSPARHGLEVARVVEAAYQSAAGGGVIAV